MELGLGHTMLDLSSEEFDKILARCFDATSEPALKYIGSTMCQQIKNFHRNLGTWYFHIWTMDTYTRRPVGFD